MPIEARLTDEALIAQLREAVGRKHVITRIEAMAPYCHGIRFGRGRAVAVVRPGTLLQQWNVVKACVAADKIVIMQAANTGLTGGSTPDDGGYDRGVVVINTTRIVGVHPIDDGRQVVCLPGATLHDLERLLAPLGREPHSVIGSSCIGASVMGGVCNNSGGSLIQRGPAYTEMALFARLDEQGELRLVNHLGMELGSEPEEIFARLERGGFADHDIIRDPGRRCSDRDYAHHVRDVDAPTPARFNADPSRLYESSGSAGRLILFAVRLDTFPKDDAASTFYIGTNDPRDLTMLRREMLRDCAHLPVAAEYMDRAAFDIAALYGKDTFLAIELFGTRRMPLLYRFRTRCDALVLRLTGRQPHLADRLLQRISRMFPAHLPRRLTNYRDRFEHHLILKMSGAGIDEARTYLRSRFPSADGDFFECSEEEGRKAFLHRFAAAGAAIRYSATHAKEVEDIVALDIALPRNEENWVEQLPPEIEREIVHTLHYGHFFCHVFHHDYIVRKGTDTQALEHSMLHLLDARGAEYPAEHNVGHLYRAKPALVDFYRDLDPCNQFNSGIGKTSKYRRWNDFPNPG